MMTPTQDCSASDDAPLRVTRRVTGPAGGPGTPTIALPLGPTSDEREAKLVHSPATWTGPDVRDRSWVSRASESLGRHRRTRRAVQGRGRIRALGAVGEPRTTRARAKRD